MRIRASRVGHCIALCALAAATAVMSGSADVPQDVARVRSLSRVMFEKARAYQLARQVKGGITPISLEAYVATVRPTDATTLLARMTGRPATPPALPTPERMFQQAVETAYQKLLTSPISCCLCSTASNCNDSLFCNGGEICQDGRCGAGTAPCIDGNPCTTDDCVENSDRCFNLPVPPPDEVAQLDLFRNPPLSSVATLTWSSVFGASAYNVYRGASANLGDLSCFLSHVTATTQNDDGALPAHAFYFLVTSLGCGESGLGTGYPDPRRAPPTCP